MRDYLQHGRRHAPGGTDPIPGLGAGISWAYISGSNPTSCPHGTNTLLVADQANFYTNDSAVFDVHLNASSIWGIRMLADGHYLYIMGANPSSLPSAGALYALNSVGGGSTTPPSFSGPLGVLFPTGGLIDMGSVVNSALMSVGSFISAPTLPLVARLDNSGSSVDVSMYLGGIFVMQLDSDPTELS